MDFDFVSGFLTENSSVLVILIIGILAVPALVMFSLDFEADVQNGDTGESDVGENNGPIGGQRDEHGCLNPAGYGWDGEIGACIRNWELDESQIKAAKIAVDYVGREKGLTVTKVETLRCPGCFKVHLDKYGDRRTINLFGWKVAAKK